MGRFLRLITGTLRATRPEHLVRSRKGVLLNLHLDKACKNTKLHHEPLTWRSESKSLNAEVFPCQSAQERCDDTREHKTMLVVSPAEIDSPNNR